eukprot:scaffold6322_cov58-Phaeocystis_antarctica.AAC.2
MEGEGRSEVRGVQPWKAGGEASRGRQGENRGEGRAAVKGRGRSEVRGVQPLKARAKKVRGVQPSEGEARRGESYYGHACYLRHRLDQVVYLVDELLRREDEHAVGERVGGEEREDNAPQWHRDEAQVVELGEDEGAHEEGEAREEMERDEHDERLRVGGEAVRGEAGEEHRVEAVEQQQQQRGPEALGRAREGLEVEQHEHHQAHHAQQHHQVPQPHRRPVGEAARAAHELYLLRAARALTHERGHRRGGRVREGDEDDDGREEVARCLGDEVGRSGGLAGKRQALDSRLDRAGAAKRGHGRAHTRVVDAREQRGQRVYARRVEGDRRDARRRHDRGRLRLVAVRGERGVEAVDGLAEGLVALAAAAARAVAVHAANKVLSPAGYPPRREGEAAAGGGEHAGQHHQREVAHQRRQQRELRRHHHAEDARLRGRARLRNLLPPQRLGVHRRARQPAWLHGAGRHCARRRRRAARARSAAVDDPAATAQLLRPPAREVGGCDTRVARVGKGDEGHGARVLEGHRLVGQQRDRRAEEHHERREEALAAREAPVALGVDPLLGEHARERAQWRAAHTAGGEQPQVARALGLRARRRVEHELVHLEEDVLEGRGVDAKVLDAHALGVGLKSLEEAAEEAGVATRQLHLHGALRVFDDAGGRHVLPYERQQRRGRRGSSGGGRAGRRRGLGGGEAVADTKVPLEEGGGAVGSQRAVCHDGDAVGEHLGLVEEVRREHDRPTLALATEQVPSEAARVWVHAGGGLIEEDRRRASDERVAQAHLALLPSAQRARRRVRARHELHTLEHRCDHLVHLAAVAGAVHALDGGVEDEVLRRRERREDGVELRADAERLAYLGDARLHRQPVDVRRARGGGQQPREHRDRRGLARAVGAEQAGDLAVAHVEVEAMHRDVAVAVDLAQLARAHAAGRDGPHLLDSEGREATVQLRLGGAPELDHPPEPAATAPPMTGRRGRRRGRRWR